MRFFRWLRKIYFRVVSKPVHEEVPIEVPVSEEEEITREYTEADKRGRTMAYYVQLYKTMEVKNPEVIERVVNRIKANKSYYSAAENVTGVDWRIIAVIHNLEADGSFSRQILNGERWDRRTHLVPKGYGPWDSWVMSCVTAFRRHPMKGLSLPETLKKLEGFNGFGYARKGINSPYLWSYTNHYTKGKYVSDGKYSYTAVSKQIGAAALLKMLGY